mmetsp:Transcript_26382/g.81184  ORF Transcript_26382/g.81184 Transcript_26382/m.81184 type:complete len:294 (-) Transcript_26382:1081-1962(-)
MRSKPCARAGTRSRAASGWRVGPLRTWKSRPPARIAAKSNSSWKKSTSASAGRPRVPPPPPSSKRSNLPLVPRQRRLPSHPFLLPRSPRSRSTSRACTPARARTGSPRPRGLWAASSSARRWSLPKRPRKNLLRTCSLSQRRPRRIRSRPHHRRHRRTTCSPPSQSRRPRRTPSQQPRRTPLRKECQRSCRRSRSTPSRTWRNHRTRSPRRRQRAPFRRRRNNRSRPSSSRPRRRRPSSSSSRPSSRSRSSSSSRRRRPKSEERRRHFPRRQRRRNSRRTRWRSWKGRRNWRG